MIMTTHSRRKELDDRKTEVRQTWADPEDHRVTDPLTELSRAILTHAIKGCDCLEEQRLELLKSRLRTRSAIQDLDRKFRRFVASLLTLRDTIEWVDGKGEGVPFDLVSRHLFTRPDLIRRAREAMLERVPQDLRSLVLGGGDYRCPLCGTEH